MDTDYLTEIQSLGIEYPILFNFVQGSPGTETLNSCCDMLLKASTNILSHNVDVNGLFKYGVAGGDKHVLQQLSEFLSQQYGDTVNSSDVMITAGATQGLHLILSILCQQSSPVFIEDPSYFYGFRLIRDDLQMNLVPDLTVGCRINAIIMEQPVRSGPISELHPENRSANLAMLSYKFRIPSDNEGINTDALDKLLTEYKSHVNTVLPGNRYWAAVYLIPVFSNPTGRTFSIDRYKKLVQLARKHDVLIITEDVYNLLYFKDISHAPPRLISFDNKTDPDYGRGHVISNGTFSKIIAPSLRLGWIEGPSQMISDLIKRYISNLAHSGGSFNHYTSLLVTSILRSGDLLGHLKFLRKTYKRRMDALCEVLDKLPDECFYKKSEGGFFLWLNLRSDVDAFEFVQFTIKNYGVSFLPGVCTSPTGSFKNCVRLSISNNSEDILCEGAMKLCLAYQEFTSSIVKNS